MIRFLIICTIFFVSYLGFSVLSQLDSKVIFTIADYQLETTLFTLAAGFVISVLFVLVTLKLVFLVFQTPAMIMEKLVTRKNQKTTSNLIRAMADLLIDNKTKASEELKAVIGSAKPEHKEIIELINAEIATDFDQKIQGYRWLVSSHYYNYFATKRLAQVFYNNRFYEQALDYAAKAFNSYESDSEILEILLHCHAKLGLWSKFAFIVTKFSKADKKRVEALTNKISEYYLLAAKDALEIGQDQEATGYLEQSLEFNPSYIAALDLYYALSINKHTNSENLEILEEAFILSPSFEIAEIYIRACDLPAQDIYNNLAKLVDQRQYYSVFLAIAAYLDLPEKAHYLREPKLLPAIENAN